MLSFRKKRLRNITRNNSHITYSIVYDGININIEFSMLRKHHICVCICTYKRPEYLIRLLKELEKQETEGLFDYSIVIVDNDHSESAKQTVQSYARQSKILINYFVQPVQNIALARNKAVENSNGDFLALIDDDEFPGAKWLLELYKAVKKYKVDGVLGPVLPDYEEAPPKWILKGHFFDRPSHDSGHILNWEYTRTGNALLKRDLFKDHCQWFDPKHGSGGEDKDFFRRKIEEGHVFAWYNEAPVFETVPAVRWKRTFMIKKALLRGKVVFESSSTDSAGIFKSLLAISLYTVGLPFFLILGHHIFMTYLIKNCDHLGKVLTAIGFDVVKEKYVTN
jgi:succinoglycan biosynthesis protein ExoM